MSSKTPTCIRRFPVSRKNNYQHRQPKEEVTQPLETTEPVAPEPVSEPELSNSPEQMEQGEGSAIETTASETNPEETTIPGEPPVVTAGEGSEPEFTFVDHGRPVMSLVDEWTNNADDTSETKEEKEQPQGNPQKADFLATYHQRRRY